MNVKLPGLPSFCPEELPSFVLPSNKLLQFDSILNEVFQNMHKIKWVLGNSFMELEKDVITSMNNDGRKFLPVGPIVPATLLGKEDNIGGDLSGFDKYKSYNEINCLEWLDKQNPASVVYVSFGSLIFPSEKHIESIANGLRNTKRPFLWVVKLAKDQEPKQYKILDEIKKQGLIVKWSPQTAWSEQPTNGKLVTDSWGVGVKLSLDSNGFFGGDEVARCVEEIMSGPRSKEFRKNAVVLKTAAREAVADGGSSDKNIQLFVKEVVAL
ncbi:putative UDP-glucuronosyl/UDP-glucosyltransferase [Tanacetum coccineum]